MKKQDWLFFDGYNEVRTADTGDVVFSTEDIDCYTASTSEDEIDLSKSVVDIVVNMHNSGRTMEEIDSFLMDCDFCTQEEREIIMEESYENYYSKLTD